MSSLKTLVTCVLLFLYINPGFSQSNSNENKKAKSFPLLFFDAGLGSTSYGFSGGAGIHINFYSKFTIGIDLNSSEEIAFYGEGESASVSNYLIGIMENSLKPKAIFFVGPGKTTHKDIEEAAGFEGEPSSYRSVSTTTWGITMKGQLFILRGSFLGLSLHPFVNINHHKTYGGATLNFSFGFLENQ